MSLHIFGSPRDRQEETHVNKFAFFVQLQFSPILPHFASFPSISANSLKEQTIFANSLKESISFHEFSSLFITFRHFSAIIRQFPPISRNFHQLPPISTNFHQFQPISIDFCQFPSISADFSQFEPISVNFGQFVKGEGQFNRTSLHLLRYPKSRTPFRTYSNFSTGHTHSSKA